MHDRYRFYKVGAEKFSNKFLAFIKAQETGLSLTFDFFEEEFDLADWSKEPDETWDQLLDIRAHQIAALGKPIILGFSGGTDSYTIYEVFKRNQIKIDALFLMIKDDPREQDMFEEPLKFIEKQRQEYGIKSIILKQDTDLYKQTYSNDDWWLIDMPIRINFSTAAGMGGIEHIRGYDSSFGDDFTLVVGMDKPRIKIIGDTMYSYLQDTTFNNYCDPRHEYFFSSRDLPELHIKQSYMLGRFIRYLSQSTGKPLKYFENIHDPKFFDYHRYSMEGCGRFGDLANSAKQKTLNRYSTLYMDDDIGVIYKGRDQSVLTDAIGSKEKFAMNYINGLKSMKSDSRLKHIFRDQKNYFSVADIDTKYYRIHC